MNSCNLYQFLFPPLVMGGGGGGGGALHRVHSPQLMYRFLSTILYISMPFLSFAVHCLYEMVSFQCTRVVCSYVYL